MPLRESFMDSVVDKSAMAVPWWYIGLNCKACLQTKHKQPTVLLAANYVAEIWKSC